MGCYHRHFHVIPEIKTTGGLFTNKDRGVHDSDYFIEVNVTNKAKLTTVLTRKASCLFLYIEYIVYLSWDRVNNLLPLNH